MTTIDTMQEDLYVPSANKTTRTTKNPMLPEKYSKFKVFGYWFLENLKEKGLITDHESALNVLHLFSDVPEQMEFYDEFFDESKAYMKNMKSIVNLRNAPIKNTNIKNKTNSKDTPKTKKTCDRKKKKNITVLSYEEQLIADLVLAANCVSDLRT